MYIFQIFQPEDYVWTSSCEVSGSLSDWGQKNVPECVGEFIEPILIL